MNDVVITKGKNGLGREAPGEDHISAFLFYGAKPVLMGSDDIIQIRSLAQAEAKGIVSTGTALLKAWWYHIDAFFKRNPSGLLYVAVYAAPVGAYTFSELLTLQRFANGKIRQVGVYVETDYVIALVTVLNAKALQLDIENMPLSCLLVANVTSLILTNMGVADGTLDLNKQECPYVSVLVGQDGNNVGATIYLALGKSVGNVGLTLGCVSSAQVHENIGWVERYNLVDSETLEMDLPAFCDGSLAKMKTPAELEALNSNRYIFARKIVGDAGSYFNDSFTAIASTSDYAYIENERTMDKAKRIVRLALLPKLNSPVRVDKATGKLAPNVVADYRNTCNKALDAMLIAGEISGYNNFINPDQNVLSTSKIEIQVKIQPIGVARFIEVEIGFAVKLG